MSGATLALRVPASSEAWPRSVSSRLIKSTLPCCQHTQTLRRHTKCHSDRLHLLFVVVGGELEFSTVFTNNVASVCSRTTGWDRRGDTGDKNKADLPNAVRKLVHLFGAMFRSDDFVLASQVTKVKHTEHPCWGERAVEACMTVPRPVKCCICVHRASQMKLGSLFSGIF